MVSLIVAGSAGRVISALLTVIETELAGIGGIVGIVAEGTLVLVDALGGRSEEVEDTAGRAVGGTVAGSAVEGA